MSDFLNHAKHLVFRIIWTDTDGITHNDIVWHKELAERLAYLYDVERVSIVTIETWGSNDRKVDGKG